MLALFVRDEHVTRCDSVFTQQLWLEASIACGRESMSGDPATGIRAARALFYGGDDAAALGTAARWFDTEHGAAARQIAGMIHLRGGNLEEAQALLRRARDEHVARGQHDEAVRDAQQLIGALTRTNDFTEALDTAELAVADAARAADRCLRGSARLAMGMLLAKIGDHGRARAAYWDAQDLLTPCPAQRAWVELELGLLVRARGQEDDGVQILETALEIATAHHVVQVVTAARLNLARAERERGHLDAAAAHLGALAPEVRSQPVALLVHGLILADRGDLAAGDELLALAAKELSIGDYTIDIAVERGRIAELGGHLDVAERFYRDAIAMVEKLRSDTSALELRPWVLARRREPYGALLGVLARADRRSDALEIAEQLHARTWLDALLDRSGAKDERARASSARSLGSRLRTDRAAAPLSDAALRSIMARRDALVFATADAATWRFHVVDGAIASLERLPADLETTIDRWQGALSDAVLARQLGDLLVPPAARARASRPLYVVADGVLGGVPFAALRPDGHLLVENRTVVRLPGLVALQCRTAAPGTGGAVFLGDSLRDRPLAEARREVTALARELGGEAFVGDAASLALVRAHRDAALLHLAVHADGDASGGGFLLSDRRVSAADVIELQLAPRVAVLAGCATAVSRDIEGWGALSSAFLVAGSRSVVATLRSVPDTEVPVMMRRFYASNGAHQPAEALAAAQRELLGTGRVTSWASFVVYGSGDDCDLPP